MVELHGLPDVAVDRILHYAGILPARAAGWAIVSRQWNRVLSAHGDWENACEEMGLGGMTRPDGEKIDFGRHHLSYAESRFTQRSLMRSVIKGKSVFITGQGGTGKTILLGLLKEKLTELGSTVHVTATTGMAATLIGGTTIHRWAGVGLAKESASELLKRMRHDTRERWRNTDVLIIDEISMMDPDLFAKYDEIAKHLRGDHGRVFGGIQLITSGDFLQLPPVKPEGALSFLFQHPLWETGVEKVFLFKHVYRTTDVLFTDVLSRVRTADHTQEDVEILKTRLHVDLSEARALGILPTRMYSHRADVDGYNATKLAELTGQERVCQASVRVTRRKVPGMSHSANNRYLLRHERAEKQAENACPVARVMKYKDGAQVLLTVNLDPAVDLVNGSRGVVTDAQADEGIEVKFLTGETRVIKPFEWTDSEARGDKGEAITLKYAQVPLALAWSYTVHRAQGATLDCAEIDLGRSVFAPGMSYVALSRVRALKSLSLLALDPSAIRADSLARSYYAYLERYDTHRGFRGTVNRIPFPTVREIRGLVQQLPAIKRRRDAAKKQNEQAEKEVAAATAFIERQRFGENNKRESDVLEAAGEPNKKQSRLG